MPAPPLHRPPKWADVKDHLVLYHGTASVFVDSILTGVDPTKGARDRDFGPGFYTTTFEHQAREWAEKRARKLRGSPDRDLARNPAWRNADPVVVWFRVPLAELAPLRSLAFVRPNPDNEWYWSFVCHCRLVPPGRLPPGRDPRDFTHGYDNPDGSGMYDMVCGPVALEWASKTATHFRRDTHPAYDQFSFHTAAGVAVFDHRVRHGTRGRDYDHTTYPLRTP